MVRWSRRFMLLTAAALAWSAVAGAQSDDVVARSNVLFEDGKRLLAEGKVGEACDKLAESNRLAARGGTLLNLGLCHEQQGKLLAARRELRDALALAKRDARADRIPIAAEHLAAVEARLSFLKLVPPPNVGEDKVEIRIDDAPIARREWSAVAVEAGRHVLVATASGFRPRESVVTVPEGPPQRLTTPIEALVPEGAGPATATTPPAPADANAKTTHADAAVPSGAAPLRTAALVAGITGVAVSLITGAWALERKGVVRAHCNADSKACDPDGSDAASLGRALVITSTVAFAVGAVGFGAWLVLPDGRAPGGAGTGGARAAGFTLGGAF